MDDLELQTVGIVKECRVVPGPVRVLLGLALDFDVLVRTQAARSSTSARDPASNAR